MNTQEKHRVCLGLDKEVLKALAQTEVQQEGRSLGEKDMHQRKTGESLAYEHSIEDFGGR